MQKLQEQSVGDKGVLTANYNSIVRLANQVGRTNFGPGLIGMIGAGGSSPLFRVDKSNNAVPDAQGITSTATLSGTVKRRTLDIELPVITADSPLRPNWDEWGLFDVVKLQTTGFRRYPYYDTLGSTTLGATTDTNESVGVLRWDFPLVMLGSSTSKALAYQRNAGDYPGLDSSATFLGTSTFMQNALHVEGESDDTAGGGNRTFDAPHEFSSFDFSAIAQSGAGGVTNTAALASTLVGSRFEMNNKGINALLNVASTGHAVDAETGPIEVRSASFEYRHNALLGQTGVLGTSSEASGGIIIDRGDGDFPLSHGVDRLEWKLNGKIKVGDSQDGLIPVQTSGCIQCVIVTAKRVDSGNSLFDINKHEPGGNIISQHANVQGFSIFASTTTQPFLFATNFDNMIRGFNVFTTDCFRAGEFFSLDVDSDGKARDATVTMFVKYKSPNCDFGA